MTFADWKASVEPKVQDTWNLHSLLPRGLDFLFFFLPSAASSAKVDAFVRFRIGKGEKAASLNLGPMLSEGLLAQNPEVMDRFMRTRTLDGVTQKELFALLDQYCNPFAVSPPLSRCQVVTGIIAPANLAAQDIEIPAWMKAPMFNHLFQINSTEPSHSSDATNQTLDLTNAFSAAQSLAEAGNIVAQEFAKRLAKILFAAVEDLELAKPVHTYGLDSLVAVELRNWFEKELKSDVAIFEILGGATFLALGVSAASKSLYRQGRWTAVD
ncbi:hypothetical protein MMC17_009813 [Xylographa soralifera]|nr:hypothetical protein [Xylographa soralifera]